MTIRNKAGYTDTKSRIGSEEGNDWLGMLMATVGGLMVAIMVLGLLDALTGYQLHYWVGNLIG